MSRDPASRPARPHGVSARAGRWLRPLARGALVRATGLVAPASRRVPHAPRVLLIRPDHLGDVLLAGPSLAVLRAALPDARLDLLVGPWSLEVARRGADVDRIEPLAFPGFTRRPKPSPWEPYAVLLREARRLRARRYDLAVILRPDHWWGALLAALGGIPRRVGYDLPLVGPLLTDPVAFPRQTHVVLLGLRLVERAAALAPDAMPFPPTPPPAFRLDAADERAADALLARHGLTAGQTLLIVHPGSGSPLKAWPAERWAAAAFALAERLHAAVLITGGPDERALTDDVAARMGRPVANLAGETALGTLAALLRRADLVVGADSGPLHLAAAMGARTLRLYGPTDPRVYGPWPPGPDQRVARVELPCGPCGDLVAPPCGAAETPACMAGITVAAAVAAAPLWPSGALHAHRD